MDRGAWWSTVHGLAKRQTWPSSHTCKHTDLLAVDSRPFVLLSLLLTGAPLAPALGKLTPSWRVPGTTHLPWPSVRGAAPPGTRSQLWTRVQSPKWKGAGYSWEIFPSNLGSWWITLLCSENISVSGTKAICLDLVSPTPLCLVHVDKPDLSAPFCISQEKPHHLLWDRLHHTQVGPALQRQLDSSQSFLSHTHTHTRTCTHRMVLWGNLEKLTARQTQADLGNFHNFSGFYPPPLQDGTNAPLPTQPL